MKIRTVLLLLCLGAAAALADTLKLKNGTTMEGTIVAETDTEYTLEQTHAGGTIKSKEIVRKSDVAEVLRATPEQKAAQAMKEAYQATLRYKLDPQKSYPKDYYDKVIAFSFRKFLADYPQSPYQKEMEERIAAWEAERDKVAAGQVKRNGQWTSAAEAAAAEGEQLLQQVRAALLAGRHAEAAQGIETFLSGQVAENLAATAKELREKIYQQWCQNLQQSQTQLQEQLTACNTNLVAAKEQLAKAQEALRKESAKPGGGFKQSSSKSFGKLSDAVADEMKAIAEAQKKVTELERQQLDLNARLAAVNQSLPQIQARMESLNIAALPSTGTATTVVTQAEPPPTPPSSPAEPEEEGGILSKIAEVARKYWLIALVAILVVVWFVSRKMGE